MRAGRQDKKRHGNGDSAPKADLIDARYRGRDGVALRKAIAHQHDNGGDRRYPEIWPERRGNSKWRYRREERGTRFLEAVMGHQEGDERSPDGAAHRPYQTADTHRERTANAALHHNNRRQHRPVTLP